jgi:hypothetical protein
VSRFYVQQQAWSEQPLPPVLTEVGVQVAGEPEVFQVHELQKR